MPKIIKEMKISIDMDVYDIIAEDAVISGKNIGFVFQRIFDMGLAAELVRTRGTTPLSPHTPLSPPEFLNNNKKLNNTLKLKTLDSIPIVAAKKQSRKKPKRDMPKAWVDAADAGKIPLDDGTLEHAEKAGYDYHDSVEIFAAFVNHHLARGNQFSAWNRAWHTWIKNEQKFARARVKKSQSVISSEKTNPIEDMLHD